MTAKKKINSKAKSIAQSNLKKQTTSKNPLPKNKDYNSSIGRFLIKFFVIFGITNILIEFFNLDALNKLIANITAGALGLAVSKVTIFAGTHAFVITNSCTGLVSASILGAIIFALRKPSFATKLTLFIWGAIALLLLNIPRIMIVLLAAQAGFDAELVHEATWFVMSALVLAIWYFGTKRITKIKDFSELA